MAPDTAHVGTIPTNTHFLAGTGNRIDFYLYCCFRNDRPSKIKLSRIMHFLYKWYAYYQYGMLLTENAHACEGNPPSI